MFGWLNVGIGAIGILVPLVPTTPFVLVAAWAFARSSQRFHDWLVNHRSLGPPIVAWRSRGAISKPVKRVAMISLAASFALALLAGVPSWALGLQAGALLAVGTFILTRPTAAEASLASESNPTRAPARLGNRNGTGRDPRRRSSAAVDAGHPGF